MPAARWGRETERGIKSCHVAICMEITRAGMHGAATNPVDGGIRRIPEKCFYFILLCLFFTPSIRDLLFVWLQVVVVPMRKGRQDPVDTMHIRMDGKAKGQVVDKRHRESIGTGRSLRRRASYERISKRG